MDGIKKNTVGKTGHHYSSSDHQTLQRSSTLNRRFVKRPAKAAVNPQISSAAMRAAETLRRRQLIAPNPTRANLQTPSRSSAIQNTKADDGKIAVKVIKKKEAATPVTPATQHPVARLANARTAARKAEPPRHLSAQELKDRAIQQALRRVSTMNEDQTVEVQEKMSESITKKKPFWQKRKLAIALAMSAVSIALLGYLVHINLPDLSVKVAAMQTGIDGAYPSYIPKNYRLDGLVSEKDGKITMNFSGKDSASFTLTEEKSNWDSSAVLANFVTPKWENEYSIVKGQGLTIYVAGSNAVWVNGGILYFIEDTNNFLTKQQLHDIAVSL
ncbi:MAG: hypothetical protein LBT19_02395 [Candidatus Nomurabacteria bacterium]|jgi:hypothetical protein|nr:hypothetical protein [Candidatus Nomurabacteria bacterium]